MPRGNGTGLEGKDGKESKIVDALAWFLVTSFFWTRIGMLITSLT